jgi:replicative DNA helicase
LCLYNISILVTSNTPLKMQQEIIKELQDIISKPDASDREIVAQLKELIEKAQANVQTSVTKSLEQLYTEQVSGWQTGQQGSNILPTQFKDLNEIIGGFLPGEFVVIGARPSMGKTQLLINLALNFSEVAPVLFFSYDLSDYMLANRFISTLSGIPIQNILQQTVAAKEKQQIGEVGSQLKTYSIYLNGGTMNSLSAFRHQCMEQIKGNGIKVIMVDSLQHIALSKFRGNREQEIGSFTRELKSIANETGAIVIASSQLSRSVETRKESKVPALSDLRESGSIEQDADKVIMLYRPEYYGISNDALGETIEGETHLHIAKNRYGNVGVAKLRMNAEKTGFIDMEDYFGGSRLFKSEFTFSAERKDEIQ